MVGSASMLAGFKQMAVAVVVFITGRHVLCHSWLGVGSAERLQELPMISA